MNKIDLTGQRFGKLIVLRQSVNNNQGRVTWECQCDCGKICYVTSDCLRRKNGTKSCGCISKERISNLNKGKIKRENLTSQRFGRLTVIEFSHKKGDKTYWKCKCDCGKEVLVRSDALKTGHTNSCGCYNKEILRKAKWNETHGKTNSKIHSIWFNMKNRCYNPNTDEYSNYGGRGIKVCDEWLGEHGAENFIKWAFENGYDENADFGKCTIDRINVNQDYCPENCRWATMKEQANNKRNNRYITYNGETKTLKEWCEYYNLNYDTVKRRIYSGWSVEEAFFKPIGNNRKIK